MNEQLALDSPYDKTQVEGPVEARYDFRERRKTPRILPGEAT